jgi:hypothetical protein
LLFIWSLVCCTALFGKVGSDSANQNGFRIKGIDFRYGFGRYAIASENETALAAKFTNDQNNFYQFNKAYALNVKGRGISDLYVGIVLVPSYYIKNRLFYREEFRIGLSFTLLNNASSMNLTWDTLQTGVQKEVKNLYYQYKYNSQRVHFSYLLNTRIIKNHFALYGGIGGSVGFSSWRTDYDGGAGSYKKQVLTIQNNQVSQKTQNLPLENYTTESASLYVPIGIKYNVSCELNLFFETQLGLQYFYKGLKKTNTWIPNALFNFGFRYKLIDDAVATKKGDVFW